MPKQVKYKKIDFERNCSSSQNEIKIDGSPFQFGNNSFEEIKESKDINLWQLGVDASKIVIIDSQSKNYRTKHPLNGLCVKAFTSDFSKSNFGSNLKRQNSLASIEYVEQFYFILYQYLV